MNETNCYLALVHHPIRNKNGEKVTTSVTNLDIHDIARSCRTYGIKTYYIVTPLKAQHELVERILDHWKRDNASAYNPDRQDALSFIKIKNSVEEVQEDISSMHGENAELIVTGANFAEYQGDTEDLKGHFEGTKKPQLVIFGTGWGLHEDVLEMADYKLKPLSSGGNYNHLSVRSAVAIYLDRLFGI
ncbi:MAG: RNA methyltransferase [Bacteriovoracaceae bacterium]